jgi:hypothetical protein
MQGPRLNALGVACFTLAIHCTTIEASLKPPIPMTLAVAPLKSADWLNLGPILVGVIFVWTGVIKAIAPQTFRNHLQSLGWIPWKLLGSAVTAASAFEVAWGMALVTGVARLVVFPATVLLLTVFTAISWWGVKSGKAEDCGCYGGYIQPSIKQSIALNTGFAILVIAAWIGGQPTVTAAAWQITLIVVSAVAIGLLAWRAQRFEATKGRPLLDTNPLKIGKKWKHRWAHGATAGMDGEILVAYLGANCPYCSQFVKVANAMTQSPDLPKVIGVMAASEPQVKAYIEDYGIRFPVATVSPSLMSRLASAVPSVVIVESGRIKDMWVGNMPPAVVDRFRDAFFPNLANQVTERRATS